MAFAGTYAALGCGFVGGNKSRHPYNSTWDRPPNVPAHQTVKSRCVACHTTLDADPRFDMPKFCPNPEYIREMQRYGILPKDVDPARQRIDPYATDRRYWALDWTDLK